MMSVLKATKKPVTVEAMLFTEDSYEAVFGWIDAGGASASGNKTIDGPCTTCINIDTLEGTMTAKPGDYIIKGVQGEFYPCKADIFEQTYNTGLSAPQTDPIILTGPDLETQCVNSLGEISDGFHTINELYEHRCTLMLALMSCNPGLSWFSKKHHDGGHRDGWFICGIELPTGDITYHVPIEMWKLAVRSGAKQLERGKEWDGHTPKDVVARLRWFTNRGHKHV